MSLLDVRNLSIRYAGGEVVSKLSFSVDTGESVGLVGESGSGKTQTALAIMGLLPGAAAVSGSIAFGGTEIVGASERPGSVGRRTVQNLLTGGYEGRLVAEGTPSSLKAADRGNLRLQLMLAPGRPTPDMPAFVVDHRRVGNNLLTLIAESDAGVGIAWAQDATDRGITEEYALGSASLEDVYIRLTGHTSKEPNS